MNHLTKYKLLISGTSLLISCLSMNASSPINESAVDSATIAAPRNVEYEWMSIARWNDMHNRHIEIANKGEAQLLFLGDSITEAFEWDPSWKAFEKFKPACFGIGGDKTQNVLWRLNNGDVGKLDPKAVVLLIGVNNYGHLDHSAEEVFEGTKLIVENVRIVYPNAKILIMATFPYEHNADHANRARVKKGNAMTAQLADNNSVFFMDIGDQLLEPDGSLTAEMAPDFLHIQPKGYKIWTEAILPTLEDWFKE